MASKPPEDAFNFHLTGEASVPFLGYNSAQDPTNLSPQYLVEGSKNTYLNNRGNVAARPGLKLIGDINTDQNGVVASYEYENVKGDALPIWVLEDGMMQFNSEGTWYTLATFDKNRFIFAPWWDDTNKITLAVMVNGDHNLYAWSGAILDSIGTSTSAATLITGTSALTLGYSGSDSVEVGVTQVGTSRVGGIVFFNLPQDGDTITVTIGSSTFFIVFRSVLPGAPTSNSASILIGASAEATNTNLLAFFANPGNLISPNFLGLTDGTIVTAIGTMTYSDTLALSTGSDETWSELGFLNPTTGAPNPQIIVGGVSYSYDLLAGRYLVGLTSAPPPGSFAYSSLITTENTPSADFSNDFIVTLNNQLIVSSYTSKVIHISFDEDYTLYTQGNDLIQGDPDFAVIDEFPTGMVAREQSIIVFAGNSSFYTLTPNTPVPIEIPIGGSNSALVITQVDKQVGAANSAAISQEFISTVGTDIIYISQDHQLRIYGTLRNLVTQKTPSLSIAVRKELMDADLTGGALRFVDEFAYITAPAEGRTFLYQIREDVDNVGNLTSRRLWQPFQEWNISRVAVVNGITEGYSSSYPQAYQLWDTGQWYDDSPDNVPSPYECIARWAYQNNGLKTGLVSFGMAYYEGYIAPNSELNGRIRFDYLGGTKNDGQDGIQDVVISSLEEPGGNGDGDQAGMTLFAGESDAEIGVSQTGTQQLGGTTDDLKGYPKFRVIQDVEPTDVFEYQMECFSYSAGSRWEIKAIGTNATQSTNNPTYLRKA